MATGDDIVLLVKVVNRKRQVRRCSPVDVKPDETVTTIEKTLTIRSLVPGESCKGVHVNEVRMATMKKVRGKWVPNVDGRRIIAGDGCYDKSARVWIA